MEIRRGDILTEGQGLIFIPVNMVGILGAGLAKQWAQIADQESIVDYKKACTSRRIVNETIVTDKYVLFPTKGHWREKSKWSDIASRLRDTFEDLESMLDAADRRLCYSVSIPKLGFGLGGLDWQTYMPVMVNLLLDLEETTDLGVTLFV